MSVPLRKHNLYSCANVWTVVLTILEALKLVHYGVCALDSDRSLAMTPNVRLAIFHRVCSCLTTEHTHGLVV